MIFSPVKVKKVYFNLRTEGLEILNFQPKQTKKAFNSLCLK